MTDGDIDRRNLVEILPVNDIYADGIAMVEPLSGDNVCVTYFRYMRIPGSNAVTRVVCARIIRPRSSLVTGQIATMLEKWDLPHDHIDLTGVTK